MNGDSHLGFIVAAYIAGVLLIGGMIALVVTDYANLKKTLTRLSERAGRQRERG